MTSDDRELLQVLRRQQEELQRSLARIDVQLGELEARTMGEPVTEFHEVVPPPIPDDWHSHLPPLPSHAELEQAPLTEDFHPMTAQPADLSSSPETAPEPSPADELPPLPAPSIEMQFGKWLIRIGAVLVVLSVVFFGGYIDRTYHLHEKLGPVGKFGLLGMISMLLVIAGQVSERRRGAMTFFGRTLTAAGLASLYYTFYAAYYSSSLHFITSPVVAGSLLLAWAFYVFAMADRKKSQTLSLFAIAFAYVSTALNPVGAFTMGADLILAATAVLFLLRNGWAALSYLSLVGTYGALLRRLIVDENGELVFTTSHSLRFWPHAIYLVGAWSIFTAAVLFSTSATFRGSKRIAFLSLNNGLFAGLLAMTAYFSGYGYGEIGWTLLDAGLAFLAVAFVAGIGRSKADAREIVGAYVGQGLTLFTAGLMVIYTGISRGILLALETFFLGTAGAYSRSVLLRYAACLTALCATLFLVWEIGYNEHDPWLLGLGGAAVMFANAWLARRDLRDQPEARETIVLASSYYCTLALGLIYTTMSTELGDATLPPMLALVALALTWSIYRCKLYELPPIAQVFLLGAQWLVLFPTETGEELPGWSITTVAAVTLALLTWWSRQRVTRAGSWIVLLNLAYALALVGLTYHAVRPSLSNEAWIVTASLLSVAFLAYGAFTRVWPIAVVSQVFLAVALYHYFFPSDLSDLANTWSDFPWTVWGAAVPIAVIFATGRAGLNWLKAFPEISTDNRASLHALARAYQVVALAMVIRLISARVAPPDQMAMFLFLGTLLLSWNVRRSSSFGVRCSFVLSALGTLLYLENLPGNERALATGLNGVAVLAFLCQPALLRHAKELLVTEIESWGLIFASVALGWFFISAWVISRIDAHHLTTGWALYAVFLFFFGLLVRERRVRWCGLAVLLIAIVRVFGYDFWGFSTGYRLLTFVVLAIITLGLGFIYARFGERLKNWL